MSNTGNVQYEVLDSVKYIDVQGLELKSKNSALAIFFPKKSIVKFVYYYEYAVLPELFSQNFHQIGP